MSHALTRTNPKGVTGIWKCIKCGREPLDISAVSEACPADFVMSDEAALLASLSPQRCAECDCENGGTDCNWMLPGETHDPA